MKIVLKTPEEIAVMAHGGKILADIFSQVLLQVKAGVTTRFLDSFVDVLIKKSGGSPSFKTEEGYRFATCMCVNDTVVHGLPTDEKLVSGDRLGIDIGLYYQGFHTDASWSVIVEGKQSPFLKTGELALTKAIEKCVPGNYVGNISQTIQKIIEAGGYHCVKQLVGHGVGRALHEDPEIPCYLRGKVENTSEIRPGMVFAVEVIYNQGQSPVVYKNDDGWTIVTRDGLISGLFEMTVAVTPNGFQILTPLL